MSTIFERRGGNLFGERKNSILPARNGVLVNTGATRVCVVGPVFAGLGRIRTPGQGGGEVDEAMNE